MAHTKLWTTKAGQKIRVCDMTTEHLLHTVRMMERNTEYALRRKVMSFGPPPNGEHAQDAYNEEIADMAEWTTGDLWPIYDDMVDELYERHMDPSPVQLRANRRERVAERDMRQIIQDAQT